MDSITSMLPLPLGTAMNTPFEVWQCESKQYLPVLHTCHTNAQTHTHTITLTSWVIRTLLHFKNWQMPLPVFHGHMLKHTVHTVLVHLRVRRSFRWMHLQPCCSNGIKDWWVCKPGCLHCLTPKQKATYSLSFFLWPFHPHLITYVLLPPLPPSELRVNHLEIIKFNKAEQIK